ncbi:MAG: alcohol dehydrogenase catalytic domain-containing protein [Firmicutes bacterium]|nr:alcohol dehydrogenase catalytic domain-containing protein [Bacillota bacterium]
MKAAIYQGKGKIELKELPDPKCTPQGAILQNVYASICGTDVAVYQHGPGLGHRISIGGEFGHEVCCRIKEVGDQVRGLAPGDRVYPYPRLVTGDPAKAGTIGGFSELIGAPVARDGIEVYKLSDRISDRAAALIEPFTVGCRAARRSFPREGETAVVFGAGTIGAAAAIALKYFGCGRVCVSDPSEFRCSILRDLGFETCSLEDMAQADIVIDAAGADPILDYYQDHGKVDSRMVMVAVGTNVRPVNILGMTFGQRALIGSGGYTPEDVKDVMAIMESGRWDIEHLITHEFPLQKLEEAIRTAAGTDRALNVVIWYDK